MNSWMLLGLVVALLLVVPPTSGGELVGVSVVPHRIDTELKYRKPHESNLAARVQLFVQGPATASTFDHQLPAALLETGDWAWHDLNAALPIPEGALGVWSFNGKSSRWGVNNRFEVAAEGLGTVDVAIDEPTRWISAVTCLRADTTEPTTQPNRMLVYVANSTDQPLQLRALQLYLPKDNTSWQLLWPRPAIPVDVLIPAGEKGFIEVSTGDLPLTYAAVQVATDGNPLWSHFRIKREQFDISGGWIFDSKGKWREVSVKDSASGAIVRNTFLDLLSSMHVNTAHYEGADGYSNEPALVQRNPLKRFSRLWPSEPWEVESELKMVHGVEFLGEPQYGGGKPVPPQEIFDALLPYRATKLATTLTNSEERIWRYYAGLSDYPHFDAYRVVAPAADAWQQYDRWGGEKISWAAPLETIGNLCRSHRELSRPAPCAVWSQGPHAGWGAGWRLGKTRQRRSPNTDELRAQALHALASRITSLYWFNLSIESLEKFPDTCDALRRLGREIFMLEDFYLQGDAYRFERKLDAEGQPDWELSSIVAPQGALLFALDTAYHIDQDKLEFAFGEPRDCTHGFELPEWLREPADVFRIDADGVNSVAWQMEGKRIVITDQASRDRIYVVAKDKSSRDELEQRRLTAQAREASFQVNDGISSSGF